jgi:hypothetical protein
VPLCQLCGEPNPIATRNHGLDLCEPCTAGYLAGRLGGFGVELTAEEVEVVDRRGGNDRLELHVIARMPHALPIFARFARSTTLERLRGMFDRERLRCGDPLLDARVEIRTRTPELLRPLLANDGFQSAVMTLVSSCEEFELRPGLIDVRAVLDDLDLRADVPLAVAALLRHIANAT